MITLFVEGGFPMWFLLVFGVAALITAARFARIPARRTLRVALALSLATACTAVTGVATDLATVGHQVPNYLRRHPEEGIVYILLQGFAESMAPAILGFTTLSLVALLVAVGFYRESDV
ncbi:MAG TPA: hypothetical protein VG937_22785 [Polyangiaceae bacterium]|nr:hypothetical protein [Polyangiaceae bacterium]